jgi:hypothetical protein
MSQLTQLLAARAARTHSQFRERGDGDTRFSRTGARTRDAREEHPSLLILEWCH